MVFSSEVCLLMAMVLYRFHFPSTLNQVEVQFGVPSTSCSYKINHGVTMLYAKFGERLKYLDHEMVIQDCMSIKKPFGEKAMGLWITALVLLMELCTKYAGLVLGKTSHLS